MYPCDIQTPTLPTTIDPDKSCHATINSTVTDTLAMVAEELVDEDGTTTTTTTPEMETTITVATLGTLVLRIVMNTNTVDTISMLAMHPTIRYHSMNLVSMLVVLHSEAI